MQTWYNLSADAGKTPVMSIFDDIGGFGVSAKNFLNDLNALQGDTVTLEISSLGGDVFAGLTIFNGLRASGKTIAVKVLGIAASAASLVAMAGDTIEMPENTFMMVHNPYTFAMGDAAAMRDTADTLDKISAALVAVYAKRTGKSDAEVAALLSAETWMTAQEALDAGFATAVTPAFEVKASYSPDRLPDAVRAAFKAQAAEPTEPVAEPTEPTEPAAEPGATEEPAEPAILFGETLSGQVDAVAQAAGMSVYAALWASDPAVKTVDDAMARAQHAREVQALCVLAKHADLADGFIRANAPLATVRTEIFNVLSEQEQHVDTAPARAGTVQNTAGAPAVKGADIWAARRAKTNAK